MSLGNELVQLSVMTCAYISDGKEQAFEVSKLCRCQTKKSGVIIGDGSGHVLVGSECI